MNDNLGFQRRNEIPDNRSYYSNKNTFTYPETYFPKHPIIKLDGHDPKSGFSNNNFVNPGTLTQNNIYDNVLFEEITEYSVLIDSKDRNYQVYPDPFYYEVKFNPLIVKEVNNGKIIKYEPPNPIIPDNFKNVRYIKLVDAILPFYTCIKKVEHTCIGNEKNYKYIYDKSKSLTDNLYVVLSIGNEFNDVNYKSTNDVLADSFATIYYDYAINSTHYKGYTRNGQKVFYQDNLGKIDNLKISFQDPYGVPLSINHVDKRIKSNMVCTCTEENEAPLCFKHNYMHPMNPIYQHHLHFKVGVVEPRLNKQTFS